LIIQLETQVGELYDDTCCGALALYLYPKVSPNFPFLEDKFQAAVSQLLLANSHVNAHHNEANNACMLVPTQPGINSYSYYAAKNPASTD
jgi:hypothetical protein